jgi:hypothetical protein
MTFDQVLWGISYANLTLMSLDTPFYESSDTTEPKGKTAKRVPEAKTVKDLKNFLK